MLFASQKDMTIKKFNIEDRTVWEHHRSGWKYCLDALVQNLHSKNGCVIFEPNVDLLFFYNEVIPDPWVGCVHAVVDSPHYYKNMYGQYWDLKHFLRKPRILKNCKGLFTFCSKAKDYISEKTDIPVSMIFHPTGLAETKFTYEKFENNKHKKILLIGGWMRDWQSFFDLPISSEYVPHKPFEPWPAGKYIVTGADVDYMQIKATHELRPNRTVKRMHRLEDDKYDKMLSKNIVHLPLFDVNACNTILECIMRHTPILTNRLSASEEYLGVDYPFFYDGSMEDAAIKICDLDLIKETTEYLAMMDKEFLTDKYFIYSIVNSKVYQSI